MSTLPSSSAADKPAVADAKEHPELQKRTLQLISIQKEAKELRKRLFDDTESVCREFEDVGRFSKSHKDIVDKLCAVVTGVLTANRMTINAVQRIIDTASLPVVEHPSK
jgi:hypothetical protein